MKIWLRKQDWIAVRSFCQGLFAFFKLKFQYSYRLIFLFRKCFDDWSVLDLHILAQEIFETECLNAKIFHECLFTFICLNLIFFNYWYDWGSFYIQSVCIPSNYIIFCNFMRFNVLFVVISLNLILESWMSFWLK